MAFIGTEEWGTESTRSTGTFGSDVLIVGSPNQPPTISDTPESSVDSVFTSFRNIMGSIGTTARDIGSAVGSVQKSIKTAPATYDAARVAAANDAPLKQWWQYATTQDKMMVGLALAGILVVLIRR